MERESETGHPRRWAILAALVVSLLIVVLDNTVLNVALRVLADPTQGLGTTQAQLEWAINAYTLVFAGLLFTCGVLGDRWGRRGVLLGGLALFGLASLASAYAQSPGQLIAARAVMGIGAAAVTPVTLSIISNVFDPRERGRAIGVWASAVGIASALGPVLGGALLEHFWWGSVFLINVPIVAGGLVAVAVLVPESRDPRRGRIDLVGVALSIAGLVALVYGIIDGGEHGFARPSVWAWIGLGLAVLAGFLAYERRLVHPSLDVTLFADPRFSAATAAIALIFFASIGMLFFLSLHLQLVHGLTPLQTGLLMLPLAAAQLFFAPRSAALVKRYGAKAVCATGLALSAAAISGVLLLGTTAPVWLLGVVLFLHGAGMANVVPPATESTMSAVPREKAGVASAVSNTVRQVAAALGVAVLGSVVAATYRDRVTGSLASLPAPARPVAAESISGAHAVAGDLGAAGAPLVAAANDAFVTGVHTATVLAASAAVLGAIVVLAWLPGHGARPAPPVPIAAAATGNDPAEPPRG
ncbi:MAG: MFS transporter [Micromonosporaceae bacterium]